MKKCRDNLYYFISIWFLLLKKWNMSTTWFHPDWQQQWRPEIHLLPSNHLPLVSFTEMNSTSRFVSRVICSDPPCASLSLNVLPVCLSIYLSPPFCPALPSLPSPFFPSVKRLSAPPKGGWQTCFWNGFSAKKVQLVGQKLRETKRAEESPTDNLTTRFDNTSFIEAAPRGKVRENTDTRAESEILCIEVDLKIVYPYGKMSHLILRGHQGLIASPHVLLCWITPT